METQSLLSGFCSNSTIPSIQNPTKPSIVTLPLSSSASLQFKRRVSSKTHNFLTSQVIWSKKILQCRNSVEKIGAFSGDGEDSESGVRRKNLAVFVSGGGSNFRSIDEATLRGSIHGDIVVLITNKQGCGGAEYAREKGIPVILFPKLKDEPEGLSSIDLVAALRRFKVDFILLAGYLKLIPVELIKAYPRSILNIHPSLLPAFGGKGFYGMKVHKSVIASGARYSGPTIHFVDEHFDTGRILAQRVVPVLANDTANELAARVLHEEHKLYVEVTAALCEERIIWREDGVPLIQSKDNPNESSSFQSRYTRIGDDFSSLEQVTEALARAGLESSNLIVGIDFTKSNEWTGARSFNHRSLHHLGDSPNPYEQAISIIGRTLSAFDEDNFIPCYGFGDATTHDQEVFNFYPDERPCNGFEEVLGHYRELVPQIHLAGPTSFAPIIDTAIGIVDNSSGQYHVLMIIADGQVTRSVDTSHGQRQLSPQEQNTINAIVKASDYPLSIVLVGVGDGPWDMMQQFDDNIPSRVFDNFQFVNFTEIMLRHIPTSKEEAEFALAALMEIPSQYKATIDLQLLGCRRGTPGRIPLPPPKNCSSTNPYPKYSRSTSFEQKLSCMFLD